MSAHDATRRAGRELVQHARHLLPGADPTAALMSALAHAIVEQATDDDQIRRVIELAVGRLPALVLAERALARPTVAGMPVYVGLDPATDDDETATAIIGTGPDNRVVILDVKSGA